MKTNELKNKKIRTTLHKKRMSDTYDWWREQETYEYDVEIDYFYVPEIPSTTSIVERLDVYL